MSGFYLMHRGWMDNPALGSGREPYCRRAAWAWLTENAAWKGTRIDVHGRTVAIQRGQLCRSYRDLAHAWKWSLAAVQRFIERLRTDTMIQTSGDTGRMVITICSYDIYQSAPHGADTPSEAGGDTPAIQQRYAGDTQKKEGNKGKEEKDSGGGTRAQATQGDPKPQLPIGLTMVAAEAVQIIAAFDAARLAAFGEETEPRFPAQTDRIDAARWLKAGAEAGMAPVEVVDLCAGVFGAVHTRMAGRGRRPPRSLAIHNNDIADAIARRNQPLPPGHVEHRSGASRPATAADRIRQLEAMG